MWFSLKPALLAQVEPQIFLEGVFFLEFTSDSVVADGFYNGCFLQCSLFGIVNNKFNLDFLTYSYIMYA